MGQEGESINEVKFQPVPAGTNRERSTDSADSGKKVFPGVERFRFPCGKHFFACVQDLFDEALSPQYGTCHWGSIGIKGNVLRGGI